MAHIEKYQASALGNMLGHYQRRAELEHGYRRDNIDPARTGENYNLCERENPLGFVDERIAALDLKRAPRKDAVRMIDTVVTLPGAYDGDPREFFAAVKAELDSTFGADNCVGAWVHMDETTPHMHYASVPVTDDGRLSAKSLLNRTFMKRFHEKLEKGVSQRLGIERAGLTLTEEERGGRAGKYVGLVEYQAAQAHLVETQGKLGACIDELAEKQALAAEMDGKISEKTERLECLRRDEGRKIEEIGELDRAIEQAELEPAAEAVSESVRTLWKARGAGSREEVLAGEVEGLRTALRAAEGEKEGLEREVRELDERVRGFERGVRELGERLEGLVSRWRELGRGYLSGVGERVAEVLGRIGVRAYPSAPPLSAMADDARRASDAYNRSRGSVHRPERGYGR